jgi:hypothetical protein
MRRCEILFTTKITKDTKGLDFYNQTSCSSYYYGSKFAQLAQISGKLGFGYLSRQDAKSAK